LGERRAIPREAFGGRPLSEQNPEAVSYADAAAIAEVRARLSDAVAALSTAGARTEALAEYLPAGRVLFLPRPERLRPLGTVWRLGVLLMLATWAEAEDSTSRASKGSTGRASEDWTSRASKGSTRRSSEDSASRALERAARGSAALSHPAGEPRLFATGSLTRSHEPGRPTFVAASAERRRQLRVAAFRGHYPPGTSVNFDARPIPLDESLVGSSGVLTVRDGRAYVRWRPDDPDAMTDFAAYLAERVALLVTPPEGA
jgi:hypothetical protein